MPADRAAAEAAVSFSWPEHRRGKRFFNPWQRAGDDPPPFRSLTWLLTFPFRRRRRSGPTPFRRLDASHIRQAPATGVRITWIGHSTVLIQSAAGTVITDPVFADRASPLSFAGPKRKVGLPISLEAVPPIDAVLLSHDHYDHLDLATVEFLCVRDGPVVGTPLGVAGRLSGRVDPSLIQELDWGGHAEAAGFRLHCLPAQHFSGRSLTDRASTLWCSWFIESSDLDGAPRVYYGGDTGYAPHFRQIGEQMGAPDVIVMPIGAYEPRWFMGRVHVDPREAVQAYIDLGGREHATHLVPVHWGTFRLTDEPLNEPPKLVREAFREHDLDPGLLHVLPVGGSLEL